MYSFDLRLSFDYSVLIITLNIKASERVNAMSGKKIGYIRVSTFHQNEDRQLASVDLDKEFLEKASAKNNDRPILKEMLDYIREGDEVYIHDISRLARNIADLHNLVEEITDKGVTLRFMKESLTFTADKSDPMSQLMLSMLGAVYSFERSIMLERQREGIAVAKAAGKYTGRPKSINSAEIISLLDSGLSLRKTAKQLGISLSSVVRAKAEVQAA